MSGNLSNLVAPLVQHIDEERRRREGGFMSGLSGPIQQLLDAENRRREESQRPNYSYDEEYTPPSTSTTQSNIPTPRRQLRRDLYDIVPASTRINLNDPVSDEMKAQWRDYSNRGIIFNSRVKREAPNYIPVYYSYFRHESLPFYPGEEHIDHIYNQFKGELHSEPPREMKSLLDTVYSRDKKLLKHIAKNQHFYDNDSSNRNDLYFDRLAPMLGETPIYDSDHIDKLTYTLMDNAPTYLANKKLEKLGSRERLPYGAALHPDTFLDIMGISTRRFREAQAQAQQTPTPTPASTSQAREESGSAVITTTPASTSTARQQDNIVPGFNDITAFDPSRLTHSTSAPSLPTSNTSTPAGANSPGSLVTGGSFFGPQPTSGSIFGPGGSSGFSFAQASNPRNTTSSSTGPQPTSGFSFAQTRNPSNPTSPSTRGTNTTGRLEQNLQSRIYSLNAPGYLNFENPYPIHGDMLYPARTIDAKRNPTVAQGNLATHSNALLRRDLNSVVSDEARTNVQIQRNIHTAIDNQKKQIEEISQALQRTLGQRLQGLNPTELAKSISAPSSYHFIVQRDSGYTDPNSNDPRAVRGHQVILEHKKINKRGAIKTKGFDIVQAPNHGQALLAIEPKKHLLAQYIENENYKARDKQITAIKRNISNFINTYNRQSVGTPSDVHAANQANRAAVVRTANTLARRVSYDDSTDILGRMLRRPRGNY